MGVNTFLFCVIHKLSRMLHLNGLSNWSCIKKYRQCYKNGLFLQLKDADGIVFACGSFKYGT